MATPIPENQAPFDVDQVVEATSGRLLARGTRGGAGAGITSDSRAVRPGTLFVALRGEVHDGHAFLAAVDAQGAAVVVVDARADTSPVKDAAVVVVADTLVAWADVAAAHLEAWRRAAQRERPRGT